MSDFNDHDSGTPGSPPFGPPSSELDALKPGYKLPYYAGPCPVRAVCGVPVIPCTICGLA